jgi:hypothetical protein
MPIHASRAIVYEAQRKTYALSDQSGGDGRVVVWRQGGKRDASAWMNRVPGLCGRHEHRVKNPSAPGKKETVQWQVSCIGSDGEATPHHSFYAVFFCGLKKNYPLSESTELNLPEKKHGKPVC